MTIQTEQVGKSSDRNQIPGQRRERGCSGSPPHTAGMLWCGGWLFTIGFAKLVWWKAAVGLVIWPYFLGAIIR